MIPKKLSSFILPIFVATFNILILIYPSEIIGAAKHGVSLWLGNVLPSLLPFIIGTNILSQLGVISFLGVLLEPFMQRVFNVPGCSGFALVAGMTSGYPMGAKIVSELYANEELTKTEAEKLLSFVNNSGPLFVIGAVGVSMFQNPMVGYFLLITHYLSAIINGLLFKLYKPSHETRPKESAILRRAYKNMVAFRQKNNRSFGAVLGESVRTAMETMLLIGGFIILFCVIVKTLDVTGFVKLTETFFSPVLSALGLSSQLFKGLFLGIFEVTNGAQVLSQQDLSFQQLLLASAIISFGGLSIHFQAITFLSKTDINIFIYILSKLSHALISILVGFFMYPFFNFTSEAAVTVSKLYSESAIDKLIFSSSFFVGSLLLMTVAGIAIIILSKPTSRIKRHVSHSKYKRVR